MKLISDLKKEAKYLADCRAELDKEMEKIEKQILDQCIDEFNATLRDRGQEHGDVTIERHGTTVKVSVSKTVTWDSEALQAIAEGASEEIREMFKVKVTVPEREFAMLSMTEIGKDIAKARTVKYGSPRVSLKE